MKTTTYITGLGNGLHFVAKRSAQLIGWLLIPFWLLIRLPFRLTRQFSKEMYRQRNWIPKWKQTSPIANLRVDILLGIIVVFMGLLSML